MKIHRINKTMGRFVVEATFESNGFPCAVVFMPMGHRCGYVGLPKGHPLYKKDITIRGPHFEVHGGVTFADFRRELDSSNLWNWWIGFDTAHLCDIPDFKAMEKYGFNPPAFMVNRNGKAWSMRQIANETAKLAKQLEEYKK